MRNIRLTLAYDGTHFHGWQVQPRARTVQAVLEKAIQELTGEKANVLSAGRTDSGVHALGHVANFRTESHIPAENFCPALQTKLPPDIVLLDSREVPLEFHATFAAKRKHYRYVIDNSPVPLPFLRSYAYSLRRELDAEAMHAAAQSLVGTHDFRSFETDWPNKATSVRTVFELTVTRQSLWPVWLPSAECGARNAEQVEVKEGPFTSSALRVPRSEFITLDITADGFLYNMVRSITGTLINVGRGKWTSEDVARILHTQTRTAAGATAPACGLYLVEVIYDPSKDK